MPLGTLLATKIEIGPQSIIRYNLYPTAQILGRSKAGVSSSEAIKTMEAIAEEDYRRRWGTSGAACSSRNGGPAVANQRVESTDRGVVGSLHAGCVLVYLVLAALYESWLFHSR